MTDWLIVAVGVVTPVLAFLGVLVGHWLTRRASLELDRWRRREETMRMMRWAVELAVEPAQAKADAGLVVLDGLLASELLQNEDVGLVAAVAEEIALGR